MTEPSRAPFKFTNSGQRFALSRNHHLLYRGYSLYRIQALKDFLEVMAGELGGYVQKLDNIDPRSLAWVYGNAKVFDGAIISGHARLYGNAQAYGNARVGGFAEVYGHGQIYGHAQLYEYAHLRGNGQMRGHSQAYGNTIIEGNSILDDHVQAYSGRTERPHIEMPTFHGPQPV